MPIRSRSRAKGPVTRITAADDPVPPETAEAQREHGLGGLGGEAASLVIRVEDKPRLPLAVLVAQPFQSDLADHPARLRHTTAKVEPVALRAQRGLPALLLQGQPGLRAVPGLPVQVPGHVRAGLIGVKVVKVAGTERAQGQPGRLDGRAGGAAPVDGNRAAPAGRTEGRPGAPGRRPRSRSSPAPPSGARRRVDPVARPGDRARGQELRPLARLTWWWRARRGTLMSTLFAVEEISAAPDATSTGVKAMYVLRHRPARGCWRPTRRRPRSSRPRTRWPTRWRDCVGDARRGGEPRRRRLGRPRAVAQLAGPVVAPAPQGAVREHHERLPVVPDRAALGDLLHRKGELHLDRHVGRAADVPVAELALAAL